MISPVSPFHLTMWTRNFLRATYLGSQINHAFHGLDRPISSVFDILTYILLYFIIVPMILGHGYVHGSPEAAAFIIIFQTGWFIESMWSQTMVIHMLRSPKLPFIQSHPALSVVVTTLFAAFLCDFSSIQSIGWFLKTQPSKRSLFHSLVYHHYFCICLVLPL